MTGGLTFGKRRGFFYGKKLYIGLALALIILVVTVLLYHFNVIPHKSYPGEKFGIETYVSSVDRDGDGVDDQTDILNNAYEYIETKPKYKSKYYASGYPDDKYGVCTDVVAQSLLHSGYDLRELVNRDISERPEDYDITEADKNIDFRRVRNLKVYFDHTAISLTTDVADIEEWQGGDIVVFKKHIGVVSNKRNRKGIPFVIHHSNPMQPRYEEDILESWGEIVGHYRIS